jgi:hypothetical protein
MRWRNRRREEQYQLLEALASIDAKSATRVLMTWRDLAGNDTRARIDAQLTPTAPFAKEIGSGG